MKLSEMHVLFKNGFKLHLMIDRRILNMKYFKIFSEMKYQGLVKICSHFYIRIKIQLVIVENMIIIVGNSYVLPS